MKHKNIKNMYTISDIEPNNNDLDILNYKYQINLTKKLDSLNTEFSQEILNEIVLWKVNRYAEFNNDTIKLINEIKPNGKTLDEALTCEILKNLLNKNQKGVRLAMASTILRFRNPKVYQIIDQRVYRLIYGEEFKYSKTNIEDQIKIYLEYLKKLRIVCEKYKIKFEDSDRILYQLDKFHNKDFKLKG